jgi:hypothetical protein
MFTKTVSDKQLAANRANAAKSTGPRTPEGKSRSAQNSRKHGFTAANFAVVGLEEIDAVAKLRDDLVEFHQPINSQELFAVERIALAQNALLRASTLETGMFASCMKEAFSRDEPVQVTGPVDTLATLTTPTGDLDVAKAQSRASALAEGLCLKTGKSNIFALVLRYQAQTERMYRRAVEELERLKALREEVPNEPAMEAQPEEKEPLPETNQPQIPSPDTALRAAGPSTVTEWARSGGSRISRSTREDPNNWPDLFEPA